MQAAITSAVPVVSVTVPGRVQPAASAAGGLVHCARNDGDVRWQAQLGGRAGQQRACGRAAFQQFGQQFRRRAGGGKAAVPQPVAVQVEPAGGGLQGFFTYEPAGQPMEQIVLQQQKLMRADKGIRFVFAQPKQLCQRKRAGDLRQAGGFVKCLVVQHTAQSLGLIFRAAVQPHQKGAKRLAERSARP